MGLEVSFSQEISQSLICPVCQDVFKDPVITNHCNHSFCRKCIEECILVESSCPLCRRRLFTADIHANLVLAALIAELRIYCPNKNLGCTTIITVDGMASHMHACDFTPNPCHMAEFGCRFKGSMKAMEEHVSTCPMVAMEVYLRRTEARIQTLEFDLNNARQEINILQGQLSNTVSSKHIETKQPADVTDTQMIEASSSHFPELELPDIEPTWPYGEIECRSTVTGNTAGVTSLAYHENIIYSGSYDGSIKAFDRETGELRSSVQGHSLSVWSLALYRMNRRLFSAGTDGTIKVWDAIEETFQPSETLTQHTGKVYNLSFSPDQSRLVSASSDRTIKIWNPETLECLTTLAGHTNGVNSVDFVQGYNNRVISASNDRSIKVWDIETSQILSSINHLSSEALDACTGNGFLFGSTYDANIGVWSLQDMQRVGTLSGHKWEVWQLAYCDPSTVSMGVSSRSAISPADSIPSHGHVLFSGSHDHMIKRWDLRQMTSDLELKGHRGYIHALIIERDRLISGCADKTIKLWQ